MIEKALLSTEFAGLKNTKLENAANNTKKLSQDSVHVVSQQKEIDKDSKLYQTALEFESLFMKMILDSMKSTLDKKSDPLHGGMSEDIFTDRLYDEYSKAGTKQQSFGLAKNIYYQLSEVQRMKDYTLLYRNGKNK